MIRNMNCKRSINITINRTVYTEKEITQQKHKHKSCIRKTKEMMSNMKCKISVNRKRNRTVET